MEDWMPDVTGSTSTIMHGVVVPHGAVWLAPASQNFSAPVTASTSMATTIAAAAKRTRTCPTALKLIVSAYVVTCARDAN